MKKLLKWAGILLCLLIVAIAVLAAYVKTALPNVGPPPEIIVSRGAAELTRGEYLATHVMVCIDCHSKREAQLFSMPPDSATYGQGGEVFDQQMGFPGRYYAANITPTGLSNWTDGDIYRAITTGVRKNGKPIFPVMPYLDYRAATPADVMAVIAYLRTLTPRTNKVPESHSDFPMNFILNTIPKRAEPMPVPAAGDSLAQGKYLTAIAACLDCHTPFDKGEFVKGMEFAGGREFPVPGGKIRSANITPDKQTGIGSWSKALFIQKFAQYRDSASGYRKVAAGEMQSIMPWTMYGGMTDRDLGNIYVYLQSLPAKANNVKHFDGSKPVASR